MMGVDRIRQRAREAEGAAGSPTLVRRIVCDTEIALLPHTPTHPTISHTAARLALRDWLLERVRVGEAVRLRVRLREAVRLRVRLRDSAWLRVRLLVVALEGTTMELVVTVCRDVRVLACIELPVPD